MELPWEYFMAQGGLFFPVWGKCCLLAQVLCSLKCQPRAYLTSNAQQFFGQTARNVISLNRGLICLNIGRMYLNMDQISLKMNLKKAPIPAQPVPGPHSNLYYTQPPISCKQNRAGSGEEAPEWSQNSRKPREPFPNAAVLCADPR